MKTVLFFAALLFSLSAAAEAKDAERMFPYCYRIVNDARVHCDEVGEPTAEEVVEQLKMEADIRAAEARSTEE